MRLIFSNVCILTAFLDANLNTESSCWVSQGGKRWRFKLQINDQDIHYGL